MKFWLAALSALALPAVGLAVVDMRTSNFGDSFLQADFSGTGFPLKVQAHVNSRSLFIGMFGFGWCSDWETKIEKLPEGSLKLTECGAGQETIYSPAKGEKLLTSVVDKIMTKYHKSSPATTDKGNEDMRQRLLDDSTYREQWAQAQGLAAPGARKGVVYFADNLSVEQIQFDGQRYLRTLADGTSQKFDANGRLEFLSDKNSNYLKISYANDLIREVADNTGRKLAFSYYPNKKVKEIVCPNNVKLEYKFKGEDLVEVKNMWKNTYTYAYDDTHNLTRIGFPDGSFKAITYNSKSTS